MRLFQVMNLKEALKTGKLKQFIKERLTDKPGDQDKFDAAISSMVGKSPKAPKASRRDDSES